LITTMAKSCPGGNYQRRADSHPTRRDFIPLANCRSTPMLTVVRSVTNPSYGTLSVEEDKRAPSAPIFQALAPDARVVDFSSPFSTNASYTVALDYLRECQARVSAILARRLAFYSPNPVKFSSLSRHELIALLDDLNVSHGLNRQDLDIYLCDDLQSLIRWEKEQRDDNSSQISKVVDSDEFAMSIIDALVEVVKDDLISNNIFDPSRQISELVDSDEFAKSIIDGVVEVAKDNLTTNNKFVTETAIGHALSSAAASAGSEEIEDVAKAYMLLILRDATKMVVP